MKRTDINIRDPYVLVHKNKYYLYGTRSATTWSDADGFDCYVSTDLENWDGPIEIFKRQPDFFATQNFWAPEAYAYQGKFYLLTTLGAKDRQKGVYLLEADQPTGPFQLVSNRLTPEDWAAIDGTLYFEDGKPYLIFSHSFETSPDGDMCLLPLSEDLRQPIAEPVTLFSAADASWARPIPFAKAEFGLDGDVYFTDGPSVFQDADGELFMLWSSWGTQGYAVGLAKSETGLVRGPWCQLDMPLFGENGGHAMIFTDLDDQLRFAYHFPNDHYKEMPQFADLVKINGNYQLENRSDLR
ncbi:glycoside hydrolase family 43 protein [Streptococcus caprae]|uniref:Glycoside hydrolase family 43 protein n=1 Tax=Streptococcus caprae TaxID=1640501 RepID=A0ABV8CX16_9STRE